MSEIVLPKKIETALDKDPELGVCVVYKNNEINEWFSMKYKNDDFLRQRLSNILMLDKYSDFEREFIIFDKLGNVCYSNSNAKIQVDENGIISINENEYFLKGFDRGRIPLYIGASTFEEFNTKVNNMVTQKAIEKPAGFTGKGFVQTQSQPQ